MYIIYYLVDNKRTSSEIVEVRDIKTTTKTEGGGGWGVGGVRKRKKNRQRERERDRQRQRDRDRQRQSKRRAMDFNKLHEAETGQLRTTRKNSACAV